MRGAKAPACLRHRTTALRPRAGRPRRSMSRPGRSRSAPARRRQCADAGRAKARGKTRQRSDQQRDVTCGAGSASRGRMSFPLPSPMRRALDLARPSRRRRERCRSARSSLCGDEIVAEARNAMRGSTDPTAHAEMEAIRAAAAKLGTSRLDDCTLWVTLEPCAMCAAAVSVARMKALRFARRGPERRRGHPRSAHFRAADLPPPP